MSEAQKNAPVYEVRPMGTRFSLYRDGSIMQTPAGVDMTVPTARLAEAIAAEWRAQGKKIVHASMPMTQLASTALDVIGRDRAAAIGQIAGYAAVDLLCVCAEAPDELVLRQRKNWQPLLDWCAEHFGASLRTGQGIKAPAQSPEALAALRRAIETFDDYALTGIKETAEVSGSLVLALALAEKHLSAGQVFEAAELEGIFQIEKWGEDPVSAKRHESIRGDLVACERWFGLLKE